MVKDDPYFVTFWQSWFWRVRRILMKVSEQKVVAFSPMHNTYQRKKAENVSMKA